MKHLFLLLFMMLYCTTMNAQKDVTTFLGIPVDGTKTEMRQKLIAKGFTPKNVRGDDFLEGEFNGTAVRIFIATNNNKVCRLMVSDRFTVDEANVKVRFNKLVSQFENNKRYFYLDKHAISDEEDISYEMKVNKKNFDALFYQYPDPTKTDTLAVQNKIREKLLEKYSPEQLENPTEELTKEAISISSKMITATVLKKSVWFRICEYENEYYISMFYDNEYNRANGEDL